MSGPESSIIAVLIRFESVPLSKLSFTTEVTETVGSMTFQGEPGSVLQQCIAGKKGCGADTKAMQVLQDVMMPLRTGWTDS